MGGGVGCDCRFKCTLEQGLDHEMEIVGRDSRTLDQLGAIGTVLEVGLERVFALAGGVGDGCLVDDGLGVLVRHG